MRRRHLYHIATGGTIGSGISSTGVRDVDQNAQQGTLELLQRIPFTKYESILVKMRGDSSAHPRIHLIDLADTILRCAPTGDGVIVEYGTDTMNLAAAVVALKGNETLKVPATFLGSIKGPEKQGSDAPANTITAGFFTAYGNGSGVFAVRPGGVVITSRHDTPGGSIDWHGRGIPQAKGTYFARVRLDQLVDENGNIVFDLTRKKHRSLGTELEALIEYQRLFEDGTLDTADEVPVGGRGRLPHIRVLGFGRERIVRFKDRPVGDSAESVLLNLNALVAERRENGKVVGNIIPHLALLEHVRRHRDKLSYKSDSYSLHEKWEQVLLGLLNDNLKLNYVSKRMVAFWKKYSDIPNGTMDFSDIVSFRVSSDPNLLYRSFQAVPPRGLILQATGASGIRLQDEFGESYEPLLFYCRQAGIPVVLTSSSRGEVTSFEYGSGRETLDKDLAFFAGTLDADLVEPRIALLNAIESRQFVGALVDKLDASESQKGEVKRNIYRQLLSGSHYRHPAPGEISDRSRVEQQYGIETRVDLLSGMHVRKAILASYLHEANMRKLPISQKVAEVLI